MNNQAMEQKDETKPLWRYVSKLRKTFEKNFWWRK